MCKLSNSVQTVQIYSVQAVCQNTYLLLENVHLSNFLFVYAVQLCVCGVDMHIHAYGTYVRICVHMCVRMHVYACKNIIVLMYVTFSHLTSKARTMDCKNKLYICTMLIGIMFAT